MTKKHKIEVLDRKPFGYLVRFVESDRKELIPKHSFHKRVDIGLYEIEGSPKGLHSI